MSAHKKILASLLVLLSATTGRDKACRLIQYFTRYLAASRREDLNAGLGDKAALTTSVTKLESLGASMGMTRKVLRFGRPIAIIQEIIKNMNELAQGKVINVPKYIFKILSAISLALFFLFDHYLFFERVGLANNPVRKAKYDYYSNLFWLLECIFGILKNLFDYIELLQTTASPYEKAKRKQELTVDTVRSVLDIPIAVGFIDPTKISSKKMGALGTVTSIIGLYQMWK